MALLGSVPYGPLWTSCQPFRELTLNNSSSFIRVLEAALAAGGDEQVRTVDPLLAKQVLSQLSYTPI